MKFRLLTLTAVFAAPSLFDAQTPTLHATPDRIIRGHTQKGRELAFSPDGKLLATSSIDSTVKLWRVSDGSLARTLRHPEAITSVAFSGDGAWLVTGSYDTNVRVWRVSDGVLAKTLKGHKGTVWSVDVSRDGQRIASCGEDKTIRVWRLSDGAVLHTLTGHTLNIWRVAFSPDGSLIGSGSFDKTAKLWNAQTGQLIRTLSGHTQAVVGLSFSPDSKLVATSGDDSSIRLWRVSDGRFVRKIDAGNHTYAVKFSADGKWIASGGRELSALGTFWKQIAGFGLTPQKESVRLWRVSDGARQQELTARDAWSVSLSPDGQWLAASLEDKTVKLWKLSAR